MKIIGITGGIGAGKSTVLSILKQDYHAHIIEADKTAHDLMEPGQSAYRRIVETFSEEILDGEGSIQRQKMSALVFQNPDKLQQLNNIVHPEVKNYILNEIKAYESDKSVDLFVIEAALLIEDGYKEICDELWYIYAPEEVRVERLMKSRGYRREKCESVIRNQASDEFYRANCARVIVNTDELEWTKKQVEDLLKNL